MKFVRAAEGGQEKYSFVKSLCFAGRSDLDFNSSSKRLPAYNSTLTRVSQQRQCELG